MRWTARRRLVAGAAGALALHALLALFVRSAPKLPPVRKQPPPITITLQTPPVAPPAPAPVVATKPHRRGLPGHGGAGSKLGADIRAPAQAPAGNPDAVPGFSAVEEGIAPGVSTELRGEGYNFQTEHGLPVREKSHAEQLAEEKTAVSRRIEGWLDDTKAKLRAESPDSYWRGLGDALAKGFDPGWDVYDKGPHEGEGTVRSQFWDSWKREASNYGKSGNPFPAEEEGPHRTLNEEFLTMSNEDRGLGNNPSLGSTPGGVIGFDVVVRGLAGKSFTHELIATVKITQRDDGSIFSVELFGSSGNLVYDKLALQQARKLDLMHLGPPKSGHATLWAFATTFTQVPPAPIAGCALDDFIPKNCWYPLQKRAHSRVSLLGIY